MFRHTHKEGGQAVLVAILFFLAGSVLLIGGIAAPVVRDIRAAEHLGQSKESFYVADALLDDINYRLTRLMPVAATEVLSVEGTTATATVAVISSGKQASIKSTTEGNVVRLMESSLALGAGVAFNFAMQSHVGGIRLDNSSSIAGNVFSNGPITGSGGNIVGGDAVSAGPAGLIDGVRATSSAYAHTIRNSTVDKDAYYQVISGTTVSGTSYPGSADQATTSLPISDEQIEEWKADAEAGGVITSPCPYKINASVTIGPKKINCKLEISGNITVTLAGPLWVVGDIDFQNDNTVRVSPSLTDTSIAVVADNPANRLTSSNINIQNSPTFEGNGSRSFILLVSQNESAEQGGSEDAINVQNYVSGQLLVYAGHGKVRLQNNVQLREVTAYKVHLQNSAKVTYETGLASVLFSSGPSGSYAIYGWREN